MRYVEPSALRLRKEVKEGSDQSILLECKNCFKRLFLQHPWKEKSFVENEYKTIGMILILVKKKYHKTRENSSIWFIAFVEMIPICLIG